MIMIQLNFVPTWFFKRNLWSTQTLYYYKNQVATSIFFTKELAFVLPRVETCPHVAPDVLPKILEWFWTRVHSSRVDWWWDLGSWFHTCKRCVETDLLNSFFKKSITKTLEEALLAQSWKRGTPVLVVSSSPTCSVVK